MDKQTIKRMFKAMGRGFVDGLGSIGCAFDERRPHIDYLNQTSEEAIRGDWEQVGESMRQAIEQVRKEIEEE